MQLQLQKPVNALSENSPCIGYCNTSAPCSKHVTFGLSPAKPLPRSESTVKAQFRMDGPTPTQYALVCFGADAPSFDSRAAFSLATSHYLSSQQTRRTVLWLYLQFRGADFAQFSTWMYTSASVSLSSSNVDECIRLVTYLITSYGTIDWTRNAWSQLLLCTLPVYLAVHQFTSSRYWSQLSSNSMPDGGRWRALVNAVMLLRVP